MPALTQLRCARHEDREAAARCLACSRYFCRECVTEHDGRMLCAQCLRLDAGLRPREKRSAFRTPFHLALALSSAFFLWFVFYYASDYLLAVPNHFHKAESSAPKRP